MVAKSENINQTEELKLLTKAGGCGNVDGGGGGEGGKKRVFRCKTCMKEFSSFQALGGHCTSHINKPIRNTKDQSPSSSSSSTKKDKPMTSHKCRTCGAEFPTGQALGGHMRKHKNERDRARRGALVTRSFLPEEPSSSRVTTLQKSSSGSEDTVESVLNLKLELGLTIS